MKLLIVEDDNELVELLRFTLARAGYQVLAAYEAESALALIEEEAPSLVLLDINLGGWSGLDLLDALRQRSRLPVILLTGRDREADKVAGLDAGADDYITKPFSHHELLARIRAVLRRAELPAAAAPPSEPVIEVGPLLVNVAEHSVTLDGEPVNITVTEFRLLQYLAARAGSVVPTAQLLQHVWGSEDVAGNETVRMAVYRLRRKLGDDAERPRLLHTVPGVGLMVKRT